MLLRTKRAGFAVLVFLAAGLLIPAAAQVNPGTQTRFSVPGDLTDYILGPNDQLTFMSVLVEELNEKQVRVATSGDINLVMAGRLRAAGMTLSQLEEAVNERLKKYFKDPDVTINITEFRSQPVTVMGRVGNPGAQQLEGRKTLIEVIAGAGGLSADAGSTILITRRKEYGPIPLATARTHESGEYTVAEVDIRAIEDATRPQDNIQILPHDVVHVTKADIVWVMGTVNKPGGFVLDDKKGLSLIEALARAEGPGQTASLKNAKIIRPVPGAERIEISVNLQDVLKGKEKDMILQPEDILLVPDSYARGAFRRTLDTVITVATGMAIYR